MTGKKAGTVTITVKATDGSGKKATCKVVVTAPATATTAKKTTTTTASKKSDKKNYNTDIENNESFSKYRKWNTNCFGNDKDTFFRKHFRYRYGKYCVKECNRNDSEEERYGSRGNDRKLEL